MLIREKIALSVAGIVLGITAIDSAMTSEPVPTVQTEDTVTTYRVKVWVPEKAVQEPSAPAPVEKVDPCPPGCIRYPIDGPLTHTSPTTSYNAIMEGAKNPQTDRDLLGRIAELEQQLEDAEQQAEDGE